MAGQEIREFNSKQGGEITPRADQFANDIARQGQTKTEFHKKSTLMC